MNSTELTNENRIEIAQAVSKEINGKFDFSLFEMSLNELNQNICVKMFKSEAAQDVLSSISESLSKKYHSRYVFKSSPIMSGSYVDNPLQKKTALYHFEQI